MVLMVFTILPIFWASLYKIPARNLQGWVVDFDGAFIGQRVSEALVSNQGPSRMSWSVIPASEFPGGPVQLAEAIRHEDAWAAIAINPESSRRLSAALETPDPTYNGAQAITAYAVEARSENAFRSLIRPSIQATLDIISGQLTRQVARNASTSSVMPAILDSSPQTIVGAVGYTLENLLPFDQPVATAATFVGMLYQLIMGFFIVMMGYGAREASGYDKTLSTRSLITLRLVSSFLSYFSISLFYSLLNLAFQLDVTRKFGRGGFMVFWMVNYVSMLSFALALESTITLLTPRGMPFLMLLWIIANLSVTSFPIDVLPAVFRYGYAAPFFHSSRALRTVIFGTHNRVGESVGILLAWVVLSCITLSLFQWLAHRNITPTGDVTSSGRGDPEKQKSVDREDESDPDLTVEDVIVNGLDKEQHPHDAVSGGSQQPREAASPARA